MYLGDWALPTIVTRMMVSHQKMSKSDMWAWGSHGVDPLPPRWCRDPSSLGEHLSRLRTQACVRVPLLGLRGQGWQAEWSARGAVSWVPFPRHVHARARCWDTSGEMPLMSQGPLPISKYGAHRSFSPGPSVFRKTLRCCCFSRQEQQLECFSQKPHQCRHDFCFSYKCRKAHCSHLAQSYQVFEQGVCQNALEDSVGRPMGRWTAAVGGGRCPLQVPHR